MPFWDERKTLRPRDRFWSAPRSYLWFLVALSSTASGLAVVVLFTRPDKLLLTGVLLAGSLAFAAYVTHGLGRRR